MNFKEEKNVPRAKQFTVIKCRNLGFAYCKNHTAYIGDLAVIGGVAYEVIDCEECVEGRIINMFELPYAEAIYQKAWDMEEDGI